MNEEVNEFTQAIIPLLILMFLGCSAAMLIKPYHRNVMMPTYNEYSKFIRKQVG